MNHDRSVLTLSIADIAIPSDRIGYFDAKHAEAIGAAIASDGQHDPIHVRRNGNAAKLPWTLVAGLHRLRGSIYVGLDRIDAIQVADAKTTPAELRRLELSENLDHRQRRPIERAIFMVERARQEEAIDHPGRVGEPSQTRAGRARHSASITVMAAGWRQRTATAMGCSVPTLERYQRLYTAIVEALPDLAEKLNFHPLGDGLSAMMDLASFRHDDDRRAAVQAVIDWPDAPNLQAALVRAGIRSSTGEQPPPGGPVS